MGQAKQRGSFKERSEAAIKRNKKQLYEAMGGNKDFESETMLRDGIKPFLDLMSETAWKKRRNRIINYLNAIPKDAILDKSKSIRFQEDEIGWYLFLCEQALNDPLCMDVSQLSRAAPFFAGIGKRWEYAHKVKGLDKKLREVLHQYKNNPDGLIFEILVALSYAAKAWDVEFIDTVPGSKSPDMIVKKDGIEIYVECKRLNRRTSYAEKERDQFLKIWDAAKGLLVSNKQWIWFKGVFHVEVSELPLDFLIKVFQNALPIASGEVLIYDGVEATIHARIIDKYAVTRHTQSYKVKVNSPMLIQLLGSDWAPLNSSVTTATLMRPAYVVGCEAPILGTYIEEIAWACGFTRDFDSAISLDKKSKDIISILAEAAEQVPSKRPSIIHIAAETMEGSVVERLRTQKVMNSIPSFMTDRPVLAVRFHRFQPNQTTDKLWEFDETVERYQIDNFEMLDLDVPVNVVIPNNLAMQSGSHWELYP